ncbi:MAG: NmrA family NAD(P)-binding protein, partial [Proteobacteria bacterium]|nr:NmrA family NAD(P)-binding protein [Pseudomonadota bacterium]
MATKKTTAGKRETVAVKKKARKVAKKRSIAKKKAKKVAKKKPATKKKAKKKTTKPIIVVTGATGAQGGGLVRAILADPKRSFAVRAVTRNKKSERAQELAKLGAVSVFKQMGQMCCQVKRVFFSSFSYYAACR